jgi:hypothetical protein
MKTFARYRKNIYHNNFSQHVEVKVIGYPNVGLKQRLGIRVEILWALTARHQIHGLTHTLRFTTDLGAALRDLETGLLLIRQLRLRPCTCAGMPPRSQWCVGSMKPALAACFQNVQGAVKRPATEIGRLQKASAWLSSARHLPRVITESHHREVTSACGRDIIMVGQPSRPLQLS